MDDIYFTDKRSRRNGNDDKDKNDRFTKSEYRDISSNPNLKKRSSGNTVPPKKPGFTVNIPDEEFDAPEYIPERSRTPQGAKRVSAPPPSRTPSGIKVSDSISLEHRPSVSDRTPSAPRSRTPQKPPVAERKQKKKIGGKIAIAVMLVLLIGVAALFGYGYSILGSIDYDDSIVENAHISKSELMSSPSVTNILIIGSDARDYDGTTGQRSDSMILFSIDKLHKEIKLSSFLRDSYVYIPEADYRDKLNASFSYGGAQTTLDTLEYNYEVDIDHYVIIDFDVFKQFINLLGGVPVEVTEYEAEYMVEDLKYIYIKPGINNMNGNAALMYCRMRYLDNDFERTARQRKVIKAVIGKVAKTSPVVLVDIVKQIVSNITTDISRNELISLGMGAALSFLRYDIVQQQIPAAGTWWDESIDGSDVIALDVETNTAILKKFVFEKYDAKALEALAQEAKQDYYYEEEDEEYYYDDEDYYY